MYRRQTVTVYSIKSVDENPISFMDDVGRKIVAVILPCPAGTEGPTESTALLAGPDRHMPTAKPRRRVQEAATQTRTYHSAQTASPQSSIPHHVYVKRKAPRPSKKTVPLNTSYWVEAEHSQRWQKASRNQESGQDKKGI